MFFPAPQDCYGTVDEAPDTSIQKIDGMWSPWSTLNSPCINLKVGLQISQQPILKCFMMYRVTHLVDKNLLLT